MPRRRGEGEVRLAIAAALAAADRAFDLAVRLVGGQEHLVVVVESERREVDRDIVLVGTSQLISRSRARLRAPRLPCGRGCPARSRCRWWRTPRACCRVAWRWRSRSLFGVPLPAPGRLHAGGAHAVARFFRGWCDVVLVVVGPSPIAVDFRNVKPRHRNRRRREVRLAETLANGLPLLSSTKLCGCGLPPIFSRFHLVSCAVTVAFSTWRSAPGNTWPPPGRRAPSPDRGSCGRRY